MNMTTDELRQLIDHLDRFESALATASQQDGDEYDDLANIAAYWSDHLAATVLIREAS